MRRQAALLSIAVLAALGGFLVIRSRGSSDAFRPSDTARLSLFTSGTHDLVVLIGSSSCPGARDPRLARAFAPLASADYVPNGRIRTVGIALDWDVDRGLTWLRSVAHFDEVLVGNNWLNIGVVRFIWSDSSSTAAVPQLVIGRRTVDVGPSRVQVAGEHIVRTAIGVDRIIAALEDLPVQSSRRSLAPSAGDWLRKD